MPTTGYTQTIGSVQYDVSEYFLAYTSDPKASATNFVIGATSTVAGADLNTKFQKRSNQLNNLTLNYSNLTDYFQAKYFTPIATVSVTNYTTSGTINISSAAFNKLSIVKGTTTTTLTGVSGTTDYSQNYTGLNPDSKYSYTVTPYNTGTSPVATTTQLNGTSSSINIITLPIVKGFSTAAASATQINLAWSATGASDCSYSYVSIVRELVTAINPQVINGVRIPGYYVYSNATTLSSKTLNTITSFSNTGISQNTTYRYTITPYNSVDVAGTALTGNATTPLDAKLNVFTFNKIDGTNGNIYFDISLSNFTSATLRDNNPTLNKVDISPSSGTYNYEGTTPISYNSAYGTYTLTVKGGPSDLTKTCTCTYINKAYTVSDSTVTNVYPYYTSYTVVGGGGGGGGGGSAGTTKNAWGEGGGGGGSGGTVSTTVGRVSTYTSINVSITVGTGGDGGGNTSDGRGGVGKVGSSSTLYISNINILNTETGGDPGLGGGNGKTDQGGRFPGGGGGYYTGLYFSQTGSNGTFGGTSDNGFGGAGGTGTTIGSTVYGSGGPGGGNEGYGDGGNRSVPGGRGGNGFVSCTVYYISAISYT